MMKNINIICLFLSCIIVLVMVVSCADADLPSDSENGEETVGADNDTSDKTESSSKDTDDPSSGYDGESKSPENNPTETAIAHIPADTIEPLEGEITAPSFQGSREDDPEPGKKYETEFIHIYITIKNKYKIATSSEDMIKITVGNNSGNIYSLYAVPYIQRLNSETNEWETLKYAPPELEDESQWCRVLGGEFSIYFAPQYMQEPLTEGTYRFLVFVDKYTFVSHEFTLTVE